MMILCILQACFAIHSLQLSVEDPVLLSVIDVPFYRSMPNAVLPGPDFATPD